jgi:hypothetical protein
MNVRRLVWFGTVKTNPKPSDTQHRWHGAQARMASLDWQAQAPLRPRHHQQAAGDD